MRLDHCDLQSLLHEAYVYVQNTLSDLFFQHRVMRGRQKGHWSREGGLFDAIIKLGIVPL